MPPTNLEKQSLCLSYSDLVIRSESFVVSVGSSVSSFSEILVKECKVVHYKRFPNFYQMLK